MSCGENVVSERHSVKLLDIVHEVELVPCAGRCLTRSAQTVRSKIATQLCLTQQSVRASHEAQQRREQVTTTAKTLRAFFFLSARAQLLSAASSQDSVEAAKQSR